MAGLFEGLCGASTPHPAPLFLLLLLALLLLLDFLKACITTLKNILTCLLACWLDFLAVEGGWGTARRDGAVLYAHPSPSEPKILSQRLE